MEYLLLNLAILLATYITVRFVCNYINYKRESKRDNQILKLLILGILLSINCADSITQVSVLNSENKFIPKELVGTWLNDSTGSKFIFNIDSTFASNWYTGIGKYWSSEDNPDMGTIKLNKAMPIDQYKTFTGYFNIHRNILYLTVNYPYNNKPVQMFTLNKRPDGY